MWPLPMMHWTSLYSYPFSTSPAPTASDIWRSNLFSWRHHPQELTSSGNWSNRYSRCKWALRILLECILVNYRSQRSCGKIMFLYVSLILFTWGRGLCQRDPLGQRPPLTETPHRDIPRKVTSGGTHSTGMHSCLFVSTYEPRRRWLAAQLCARGESCGPAGTTCPGRLQEKKPSQNYYS